MTELSLFSRLLAENAEGEDHFGVHISYSDLYASILFLSAIYAAGLFTARFLAMPALVGEIFTGIILGPNLVDLVPYEEAFVMLGELGLILLVLEAGIDIDLTTLRLIGSRGCIIALAGTFLPIIIAFAVAFLLGYRGAAAIAAGCTFAPTSLGIAMNVLRRSNIVNTPVGQLIVAAAIIDDMIALVILSQLQAFVGDDASLVDMLIPIASALGFLIIGGALAVFVLPKILDKLVLDRLGKEGDYNRAWMSMFIMFVLLLSLIPATYYGKASPLMGAFLAGLVFCSSGDVHHLFVSQFKRVMQWLLRIFFAASIGFQVPIQMFGNPTVLLQGLLFTTALLGKVIVGFLVPNFSLTRRFKDLHLRDCLVVGFSMAAEGEFAFVIAVFAVSNNMISPELYAAVVLAVLVSTILAPFFLRFTISHFNKKIESTLYGDDPDAALEQGIREKTTVFFCIQTKSAPAWGLQSSIMEELAALHLDVIDHRSWHPRQSNVTVVNEVYVKDADDHYGSQDEMDMEKQVMTRSNQITQTLEAAIGQVDSIVKVQRWFPELPEQGRSAASQKSVKARIAQATGTALQQSMEEGKPSTQSDEGKYVRMDEPKSHAHPQIEPLDAAYKGKLDGLFRRERRSRRIHALTSEEGIELFDAHGVDTGHYEAPEQYDAHGASMS